VIRLKASAIKGLRGFALYETRMTSVCLSYAN
jgi:hypothetical protein